MSANETSSAANAAPDTGRPKGVVFDMDGVILDSEVLWHEVRRDFVAGYGGHWTEEDQRAVMGANSLQWAAHIRDGFGVPLPEAEIILRVVALLEERYAEHLPLIPGAVEAVRRLASDFTLALASSSPGGVIEYALRAAGLAGCFAAWVSSDEVGRGKPAPDVYLEACRRIAVDPREAAAVEDSSNGIRAAHGAGLAVIAIPNPAFPPTPEALALADQVLTKTNDLSPELVASVRRNRG